MGDQAIPNILTEEELRNLSSLRADLALSREKTKQMFEERKRELAEEGRVKRERRRAARREQRELKPRDDDEGGARSQGTPLRRPESPEPGPSSAALEALRTPPAKSPVTEPGVVPLNLGSLPDCVLERVFNFLSFDRVAQLRAVSKRFDMLAGSHLTRGFRAAERYHDKCYREIKAKLPRRESVRRNHPLARHSEILTAIQTRLSLLSMTFIKYVEAEMCCFIPGKVIDELFRVLALIDCKTTPPRAYDILQEFRDISSMAMEHFEERIVPTFKLQAPGSAAATPVAGLPLPPPSSSGRSTSIFSPFVTFDRTPSRQSLSGSGSAGGSGGTGRGPLVLGDQLLVTDRKFKSLTKKTKKFCTDTTKLVNEFKSTIEDQSVRITSLEGVIAGLQTVIGSKDQKIDEQANQMNQILKRLEVLEKSQSVEKGKKRRISESDDDIEAVNSSSEIISSTPPAKKFKTAKE